MLRSVLIVSLAVGATAQVANPALQASLDAATFGSTTTGTTGASSVDMAPTRCSGTTVLKTDSGILTDSFDQLRLYRTAATGYTSVNPYVGSAYLANQQCSFLVSPASGVIVAGALSRGIKFSFQKFDLENGFDFVRVYSGTDASGPALFEFTGGIIPSDFTVASDNVFVVFSSDAATQGSGFALQWTTPSASEAAAQCSGSQLLGTEYGTISDGNGAYGGSQSCTWVISPDFSSDSITLSFSEMSLEQSQDTLQVYEGSGSTKSFLMELTGNVMPPPITVKSPLLTLVFNSDSTTHSSGFKLSYVANRATPAPQVPVVFQSADFCFGSKTMTSVTGALFSGGEPKSAFKPNGVNYKPSTTCSWAIAPELTDNTADQVSYNGIKNVYLNLAIELSFENFDLEENFDFLKVYDGRDANAPLIAELTGAGGTNCVKTGATTQDCDQKVPAPVQANSGEMFVVFSSDNSAERTGFRGTYEIVVPKTSAPSSPPPMSPSTPSPTLVPYGMPSIVSDLRPAFQSSAMLAQSAAHAFKAVDNGAPEAYFRQIANFPGTPIEESARIVASRISVDATWLLTLANNIAVAYGSCKFYKSFEAQPTRQCTQDELTSFAINSGYKYSNTFNLGSNWNYADTCAQGASKETAPFWMVKMDRTYGIHSVEFQRAAENGGWDSLFSVEDLVTMSHQTVVRVYAGAPCSNERARVGLPPAAGYTCGWTLCGQTSRFEKYNLIDCRRDYTTKPGSSLLPEGNFVKIVLDGPAKYQLTLCNVMVKGGVRGYDLSCSEGQCAMSRASNFYSEASTAENSDASSPSGMLGVLPIILAGVAGVLALALVAVGVRYTIISSASTTRVEPVQHSAELSECGTVAAKDEWVLESVRQSEE